MQLKMKLKFKLLQHPDCNVKEFELYLKLMIACAYLKT